MKTFADILYAELGEKDFLRFTGDSANNYQILEQIVSELNTSKCTLKEVEIEHEGTGHYLAYLLQKNKNINFNLCENYKTWMNHNGWQRGCFLDKGKNRRIQVHCYGSLERCERKESYKIDYFKRPAKTAIPPN